MSILFFLLLLTYKIRPLSCQVMSIYSGQLEFRCFSLGSHPRFGLNKLFSHSCASTCLLSWWLPPHKMKITQRVALRTNIDNAGATCRISLNGYQHYLQRFLCVDSSEGAPFPFPLLGAPERVKGMSWATRLGSSRKSRAFRIWIQNIFYVHILCLFLFPRTPFIGICSLFCPQLICLLVSLYIPTPSSSSLSSQLHRNWR